MRKGYFLVIEPQGGNDDVSIANAVQQLRDFRKLHPPPAPLPVRPKRGKRNSPDETLKEK